MWKIRFIILGLCLSVSTVLADAEPAYLHKFLTYLAWSENLPKTADPEFIQFINAPSPLTQKLRKKWLHQLAKDKDWKTFVQHYRPMESKTVQCEYAAALFHEGMTKEATQEAQTLWLRGHTLPKACDDPFKRLLAASPTPDKLIQERTILALAARNPKLVEYLLKNPAHKNKQDLKTFSKIRHKPKTILQLSPSPLHSAFYLYSLDRLIARDPKLAEKLWVNPKTKTMLSAEQQQAFLTRIALYKAMRMKDDAVNWFNQVDSKHYTEALLSWEIRYALAKQDWKRVQGLIKIHPDNNDECWQYWLARSLEAQGKQQKAKRIYKVLAKKRHYYGFLACMRLNKPFSFEHEPHTTDLRIISVYNPILEKIKVNYEHKKKVKASRMLNDFASELSKDEKSALATWVATELRWHGKSVYLGNDDELKNQLALRFPVAYRNSIAAHGKHYQISSVLIYAMIRQESAFKADSRSSAGANGLMQVMPYTAKQVAKREKIPYKHNRQLFQSDKNINLGVAYLHYLAKRFDHHPLLMAAAYNAGPRQVERWLKNRPPEEIDVWIETIPWQETRNYLKNVIAFYAVYQHRLDKENTLERFLNKPSL